MKAHIQRLISFGAGLALSAGLAMGAAKVGSPAPEFSLKAIDGQTHRLSDFKGKTVVLEWVNPECPFVMKHYNKTGNIPKLQQAAVSDGVVWLSINSASAGQQGDFDPAQVQSWMAAQAAVPTAYFRDQDGRVGRLYDAKTTPHMYVINPDGVLVYEGGIDSIRSAKPADIAKAENYVSSALAAIKAGTLPATTNAQPYGCAVKY